MYQALYRKWRPKTFDDVVGQEHITETLKNQIKTGRLSHAYLFTGTKGTGKTTCAKILAKAVNCQHPVDGNPCNACPTCLGIDDGSILDVVELDAASNNGVDNVRALRDEAVFSPAYAKKRVYIIDEVHMLSTSAFNALLKILEEPPEHLMFILATTELQKVPATILSRCQRYAFKRIPAETIAKRIAYVAEAEGLNLTPNGAMLLARLADGALRDALSLLDQCATGDVIDRERILSAMGLAGNLAMEELCAAIAQGDTQAALSILDRLYRDGKELHAVFNELMGLLRDALIHQLCPKDAGALISGNHDTPTLDRLGADFPVARLLYCIDSLANTIGEMSRGANRRTLAELCIIDLCDPSLREDPKALAARVAALEAGAVSAAPKRQAASAAPAPKPEPAVTPAATDLPWAETPPAPVPEPMPESTPEPAPVPVQEPEPAPKQTMDSPPGPAADPSAPGVWDRALGILKQQMDTSLYVLLSGGGVQAAITPQHISLTAPDIFTKGLFDDRAILDQIQAAVQQVTGAKLTVTISLQEPEVHTGPDKLYALSQFGDIIKFE